jgi:YHS domain-containing protein
MGRSMVSLILKLLLLLIVIRLLWRFARGVMEGYAPERQAKSVGLVRDPVCGVYVVPSRALTAVANGQISYFCSEQCRREFEGR